MPFPVEPGKKYHQIGMMQIGQYIQADSKEQNMIKIFIENQQDSYKSLYENIRKFNFIITYENVYGNKFEEELNDDLKDEVA